MRDCCISAVRIKLLFLSLSVKNPSFESPPLEKNTISAKYFFISFTVSIPLLEKFVKSIVPPKHIVLNPISHAVIIVFTLVIKNAASVYHLKDENGNTVRENVAADKWYTITAKFTPKEGKASFQFQNVNASTVYIASVTVSNDEFVEPV